MALDTSALDAYNPNTGSDVVVPDERTSKDEAFYAASATSEPAYLEQNYDQILGDFNRFGRSPVVEQLKDNWKNTQKEQLNFKASEILLSPSLSIQEKKDAISSVVAESEREASAKDIYVESIRPKKKPMELTVIGGESEEDRKKKYGEWSATPRGTISGGIADFLLSAKEKLDQYEVQDWVPLIGGVGVGELNIGDAGRLMDEISYHGLGKIFVYKPIAPGGRANPLNYGLDKGVVDAVFLGLDVGAVASLGKGALKAAVKKSAKDAVETKRIEPTFKEPESVPVGETIWFDRESPVGIVSRVNKEAAADLLAKAVKVPKMADAIGTSPAGIIQTNLLPKLDSTLSKVYPDIYEKLVASDRATTHYFDASKVDPYLFDVAAIKGDVAMHYQIMKEQGELTPRMASSYIEDTGRAFRGSQVYGKSENKGFTDPDEVWDVREKLVDKVARSYAEEKTGKSFESLSKKEQDKLKNKVGQDVLPFKDEASGDWFVKWNFARLYDPVADTFLGYGSTSAKFAHWEVGNLANSPVGKWFYSPATRLPEWITAGFARATIRATNLEKVWGDVMRNEVLSTRPRKELAQAIYKTEELGKNLSPDELRELYPAMGSSDFKALVNGYMNYRRLIDYQYLVVNDVYRTQKVTAGFRGAYDSQGKYINNLGRPVKKSSDTLDADGNIVAGKKVLVGSDDVPITTVYDFNLVNQIDKVTQETTKVHKGSVDIKSFDPETTEIYKLDKPVKKDGQVFEYAVGITDGAVPEKLLPQIPGYYPHINTEHYFIKAIPNKLTLNGREIPNDALHAEIYNQHASTVGVAKTQKSGNEYAAKFAAENPEFTYKAVFERSEIDDTMRVSMDTIKYAQDVSKSRREERLALPDGTLGRLEDPAVSLDKRMNQAARLYEWKDIDFEYRKNFIKEYGDLTNGVFPKTVADIKLDPAIADEVGEGRFKSAINVFEQYAKQQRASDTLFDPVWKSTTLKVARFLEEVSPKSAEVLKDMSHNREPILSTALKLATVKYIHLNPIKQWIIQPAQLYELHALALSQGNVKFSLDMAQLVGPLLVNALTRNSTKIPAQFKKLMKETGHNVTTYSSKEYQEILDAFYDSGIPKSIDLHAVLDGVFKSAGDELDVGRARQAWDQTKAITHGIATLPKQVGYNPAELLNQIGMWVYARSEFIRLNPTKKWNDPHNLELIASKQWGVSNSMPTRADLFPYQEGTMRAFMQFTAVSNKGMMQPLNSKFLSTAEKRRLTAIRIAAFGEKGIVALPAAMEGIRQAYYGMSSDDPSEIAKDTALDEFFRVADRGLHDMFINSMINYMFDPEGGAKTDLMLSKAMSLSSETGLPMGDFFRDLLTWVKGEGKASDVMPFMPALSAVFDTANIFWDAMYSRGWENLDKSKTLNYVLKTSEFASGYSNFEKGLAMLQYDTLVDKHKNSKDVTVTAAEAVAKMGGIQSFKEDAYYTILKQDFKLKKHIQDSAKKAITSLHALEDIYDKAPDKEAALSAEDIAKKYYDQIQRIQHLTSLYAGVHLEAEFEEEMWKQIEKESRPGMEGIVDRMMNRQTIKYDKSRKEMYEKLNEMKRSGDKDLATMLSNLAFEIENPKGDK